MCIQYARPPLSHIGTLNRAPLIRTCKENCGENTTPDHWDDGDNNLVAATGPLLVFHPLACATFHNISFHYSIKGLLRACL
jgi:hypothetical protein